MAVRSSMADLIFRLRAMTETEEGTETLDQVDLWTDERVLSFLERERTDYYDLPLVITPLYVDGSRETRLYSIPLKRTENIEPAGEESIFKVVDSLGNAASDYTVSLDTGVITFTSDTNSKLYYVRCSWYNLRKAASEIWLEKASQRARLIEWKAGQHSLKEDDEYKHCLEMYKIYAGGIQATRLRKVGYANSV